MSEWKVVQATPRRRRNLPTTITPPPQIIGHKPTPTTAKIPVQDKRAPTTPKTKRKMAVDPEKSTNSHISLRGLMDLKLLYKRPAPSTLDVIEFKRGLINALLHCPARGSKQGHSYLLEDLDEYRHRTKDPEAKQHVRPKEPEEPDGEEGDWTVYKFRLSKYERCEQYEAQALTLMQETFPDCLQALKTNEYLPTTLTLRQAMEHLYEQVKDSDATRASHMEIYDRFSSKGRKYTPNPNGPRDFFSGCDNDRALASAIGLNAIDVATVMIRALAAFRESKHSRESLRNIEERWKLMQPSYPEPELRYEEFKRFYIKELKILYTDLGNQGTALHADGMEERVQAMEYDMRTLAADYTDLESAFHTAQDERSHYHESPAPPKTLHVPNATSTVGTTLSDPMYQALMTRLDAIEAQTTQQQRRPPRHMTESRQYKYYCYSHGINLSHSGKDCRNKRAGHDNHPGATRCDPCGGCTRNNAKWMKWQTPAGEIVDTKPTT